MARQRFIWPTLWTDPAIGTLTPLERLLFIALFSLADDEGRIDASPAYLKAAVFPYDLFAIADVHELRDALAAKNDNVKLYTVDGDDYITLAKWGEHQRPKYPKPSKLPPPPDEKPCKPKGKRLRKIPGTFQEPSPSAGGSMGEASGNAGGTFPQASPMGWVGLGRDGLGEPSVPSVSSKTPRASNGRTDGRNLADLTRAATPNPIP